MSCTDVHLAALLWRQCLCSLQAAVGAFSCISLCLAYVADVMPARYRGATFGFIMASFSFGVVIGPMAGAQLSPVAAAWFAVGAAAFNCLYTALLLPESLSPEARKQVCLNPCTPHVHVHDTPKANDGVVTFSCPNRAASLWLWNFERAVFSQEGAPSTQARYGCDSSCMPSSQCEVQWGMTLIIDNLVIVAGLLTRAYVGHLSRFPGWKALHDKDDVAQVLAVQIACPVIVTVLDHVTGFRGGTCFVPGCASPCILQARKWQGSKG